MQLIKSDKQFWHGYVDFYESFFETASFEKIAEIGLFKGESIRWLMERFPSASIYGADILPLQAQWPMDDRVVYKQMDQGDHEQLNEFFSQGPFDLIIEDGSHDPHHQIMSLLAGLPALTAGGLYILEDIHTSHPSYRDNIFDKIFRRPKGNALSVLLALDHYRRINRPVGPHEAKKIACGSILSANQVTFLENNIAQSWLYKRTHLPDRCFNCGAMEYYFSGLKCRCGADIFHDADSMTFVIKKK